MKSKHIFLGLLFLFIIGRAYAQELGDRYPKLSEASFACKINGEEFNYFEADCMNRPSFEYTLFSFRDNIRVFHLSLSDSLMNKATPFEVQIGNDHDKEYGANFAYENVPDIYPYAIQTNYIKVLEWDKKKQTVTLLFKGTVTAYDGIGTYTIEGSLNKMYYKIPGK
jgi:hypothetical protein